MKHEAGGMLLVITVYFRVQYNLSPLPEMAVVGKGGNGSRPREAWEAWEAWEAFPQWFPSRDFTTP
jgi:hypothetical protein